MGTIQKASGAQIGHRWLIFNCHLLNSERATPVYEARWTSVGEQRALPLILGQPARRRMCPFSCDNGPPLRRTCEDGDASAPITNATGARFFQVSFGVVLYTSKNRVE